MENIFRIFKRADIKASLFIFLLMGLTACDVAENKTNVIPTPPERSGQSKVVENNTGWEIKGDVIYIKGNTGYGMEFDTNDENILGVIPWYVSGEKSEKMVIDRKVHLKWDESDLEGEVSNYSSNIAGCPLLKEIAVADGNDMLYAKDGILYKYGMGNDNGLYACPMGKEGVITISGGEKVIWSCAFNGCSKITSVFIPESVYGIGDAAFGDMKVCQEIKVSNANPYYKSVNGVLYTKDGKVLVAYPSGKKEQSFRVPDGVKYIASGAFMKADHIETVFLPKSITYIYESAFRSCEKLRDIKAAGDIKYVHNKAFYKSVVWKKELPVSSAGDETSVPDWRKKYDYFGLNEDRNWITGYRGLGQ